MRFVRPELTWRVLFAEQGDSVCLQRLALRCGYRISQLCVELGCGERYLHEVFTRDMGLGPKEWMRLERMVVARRMLAGGRTPDEVAESLGFAVQSTFRREFVEFYQVRPLEFQRERWGGSRGLRVEGEEEEGRKEFTAKAQRSRSVAEEEVGCRGIEKLRIGG